MAALTTSSAAFLLLFCKTTMFVQFGTFLLLTMIFSMLFSILSFSAMMALYGPLDQSQDAELITPDTSPRSMDIYPPLRARSELEGFTLTENDQELRMNSEPGFPNSEDDEATEGDQRSPLVSIHLERTSARSSARSQILSRARSLTLIMNLTLIEGLLCSRKWMYRVRMRCLYLAV